MKSLMVGIFLVLLPLLSIYGKGVEKPEFCFILIEEGIPADKDCKKGNVIHARDHIPSLKLIRSYCDFSKQIVYVQISREEVSFSCSYIGYKRIATPYQDGLMNRF